MAEQDDQKSGSEENKVTEPMVSNNTDESVIMIEPNISVLELDTTLENTFTGNDHSVTVAKDTLEDDIKSEENKAPRKRITTVKKMMAARNTNKKRIMKRRTNTIKLNKLKSVNDVGVKLDIKTDELQKHDNSENNLKEVKPEIKNEVKSEKDKKDSIKDVKKPIKAKNTIKIENCETDVTSPVVDLFITNDESFNKSDATDKDNLDEIDDLTEQSQLKDFESNKNQNRGTIWVSNINPKTTANSLRLELSNYGKILKAKIVTNGENCYGYAVIDTPENALACIEHCKKIDGKDVSLTSELPPPKESRCEKREEFKPKKRQLADDPLTLYVEKKRRLLSPKRARRSRSRSHSSRYYYIRYKDMLVKQCHEKMRAFKRNERRKIERERIDLENEKWEISKIKMDLYKKQKELDEMIERGSRNRRSRTPGSRSSQTTKNYKPERIRSNSSHKNIVSVHSRLGSPTKKPHSMYTRGMPSPRKTLRRHDPITPPPPKLSNEVDLSRSKVDPWKGKQVNKNNYGNSIPTIESHHRKRYFHRNILDVQVKDDKELNVYRNEYQNNLVVPSRSNWHSQNKVYTNKPFVDQDYRNYPNPNNTVYHHLPPQSNQWSTKSCYPKDYQTVPATIKPFYEEPQSFGEYGKKSHYSTSRKY